MGNEFVIDPNCGRSLFDDMKFSAPQLLSERGAVTKDAAGYLFTEEKAYTYIVYHRGAWWLMAFLAFILLTLCALLAGLTLGVCGLDMASLHMRSITGTAKEKQQALVVARMKRHATWMLCSLIICSVACSEYFPFVIQSLFAARNEWLSVLVSTLLLAIFAEMIPQWLIPQRAIVWGYYCWPFIWGCMWLTAIFSYPLAWILDTIGRKREDEFGVFTNDQLAILIQYHERSEKRGGMLSQDTVRVILGALNNEGRRIGHNISKIPTSSCEGSNKDVEKADFVVTQGMIVKWSAVKTVDINEIVDETFIQKIKSWSYSRVPVIGESQSQGKENSTANHGWEGKKVFGFLHIKNLIGFDIKSKTSSITAVLVKDLPLYPLPIIRDDMSVYELLNMFQLGMSRMAVVVPTAPLSGRFIGSPASGPPLWTATQRTNARIMSRMKGIKGAGTHENWTTDYLTAAQANVESSTLGRRQVHGISSPKPIGIITFEDIIDTLLQKTSCDEKDFFDRENSCPPTKTKKSGDYQPTSSVRSSMKKTITASAERKQQPNYGALRKRKVSKVDRVAGVDGADERSFEGVDVPITISKVRNDQEDSSYTQNSRGGFHNANDSNSFDNGMVMTREDIAELGNISSSNCPGTPYSPIKAVSLPSRKGKNTNLIEGVGPLGMWRHFSATPRLPQLRRVTPFSRQNYSSYEKMDEGAETDGPAISKSSVGKKNSLQDSRVDIGTVRYAREHARETSGDTISLSAWYGDAVDFEGCTTQIFNVDPVSMTTYEEEIDPKAGYEKKGRHQELPAETETFPTLEAYNPAEVIATKPYDGFPPELLDQSNENYVPNYASRTMPRMMGILAEDVLHERGDSEIRGREESFHDDRALLPSQRRALDESAVLAGTRSSSFWF